MSMHSPEKALSFLTPIGYQTGDCGYCKGQDTSASYYVSTKSLHVEHYQALVDRGWRRSGTLLYKPDLRHSCCPHYTIRLPVSEFKIRKDQRQAVNSWNRHVLGEDFVRESAKVRPRSKQQKAQRRNDFDLATSVHQSEFDSLLQPPEPAHKFEVTLEPDTFTEEKFQLYANYQEHIHHDPPSSISRSGFTRFLCNSPLRSAPQATAGEVRQKLGSFHQCYRLDGRLIAMSVLDLLPHCVSGVYFIYHADYEAWSFGKISALREACLALEEGYKYYYMGYYIHSCAKMRYKNDYKPQYILDLETLAWDLLDDEVRALLDQHHYLALSVQRGHGTDHEVVQRDVYGGNETLDRRRAFDSATAAADAVDTGTSLFDIEFPGMTSITKLESRINLDQTRLQLRPGFIVEAEDLVQWSEWSISDPFTPKGIVAQLMAVLGVDSEMALEIVVVFQG